MNRPLIRLVLLAASVAAFFVAWCGAADVLRVNVTAWVTAGLAIFAASHLP